METPFESTHNLPFEVADWITPSFKRFRIGTCEGLWRSTASSYDILAIDNNVPGNGYLHDVFDWFEYSCKRDKKDFRILEVWNTGFEKHLIEKRGFKKVPETLHVIKTF